jgi:hypothetical protein
MSSQQFRAINLKQDTLDIIERMNTILAEYSGQKLSARQIYYRFIGGNYLPNSWIDVTYNAKQGLPPDTKNTPKNYQRLIAMLVSARYAGLIDWEAIEDRGREPKVPGEWESINEIVDIAVEQFRLPRWSNQPKYVELWVEKDALAGVLGPIARRNHVPLVVNKGYSSASAMKAAAERMLEACDVALQVQCDNCAEDFDYRTPDGTCKGCRTKTNPMFRYNFRSGEREGEQVDEIEKEVVVLYLGDHDPSGKDMIRDIKDRLAEFGVPNLKVDSIALTTAQVRKFNPPPNPAKITDSRAAAYIAEFGNQSWELDALPPRELNRIVEQAIARNVDREAMDAVIERENVQRERVRAAIERSRE